MRLHPAVVIFAILAGGAPARVFGLLISIPVAAVTRILPAYAYRKFVDSPAPPAPPPPPDTETSGTTASEIGHVGAYASSSGS
ncbi:MAG: hypothetical protein ACLFVO_05005 [Chloroflexaceae bacterium]